MPRPSVLFICTHNSARSQMAEGLLRGRLGHRFEAASAGTTPGGVNPLAVEAMREIGIDISGHTSKHVDDAVAGRSFDYVVTVCDSAKETCPYVPASRMNMHQSFEDPSAASGSPEERLSVFRRVREEIAAWIDATFTSIRSTSEHQEPRTEK
ncbi:MAG: arsenate reductase ArsC [Rhodothermales bacterium]